MEQRKSFTKLFATLLGIALVAFMSLAITTGTALAHGNNCSNYNVANCPSYDSNCAAANSCQNSNRGCSYYEVCGNGCANNNCLNGNQACVNNDTCANGNYCTYADECPNYDNCSNNRCLSSSSMVVESSYASGTPQTGDVKNLLIPIIIVVIAAALLIVAIVARKKGKDNNAAGSNGRNNRRGGGSANQGRHAR